MLRPESYASYGRNCLFNSCRFKPSLAGEAAVQTFEFDCGSHATNCPLSRCVGMITC